MSNALPEPKPRPASVSLRGRGGSLNLRLQAGNAWGSFDCTLLQKKARKNQDSRARAVTVKYY